MDFGPCKHDFTHYLKALDSLRSKLHKLDAHERRITDDELLEKAQNTLIRAFGMGNYRTTDNGPFNNLLWNLAQDVIKGKTTVGFAGRHIDSFDSLSLGSPPTFNSPHNIPT